MIIDCTFKDFKETQKISKLFSISNINIYAGSNFYGGKNYEYILFVDKEDLALDRTCLFSIYDGKQLVFSEDNESCLLINNIINAALAMFKSNYALGSERLSTIWMLGLFRINEGRKSFGLENLPLDIPMPDSFEYYKPKDAKTSPIVDESSIIEDKVAPINKVSSKKKKTTKKK